MAEQPQAETIFGKVIQIGAVGERNAFLDGACHGDPALRQEVDKLVHDYFRAGEFLEQPVAQIAAPTLDQPITEKPGTQIGPYKLLQQIGEGGMGVVYMAEQKQPMKRRVALKIIKPGMDTRQVIARFEAERQALAMMDHPNIAKVLDAGQTESGRPYFVMELVNGISVTKYCDQQHLTPKERLQLFVNVCQAVQHAHQKGIIHRDLKPSNVLVALYDGKAVPKVIDFGVAKATNQSLTDKTMFTQLGQIVGTLEYMSPEQAQRNQLDVDTRSDIYSLGVILYELLSGETPFDSKQLRSAALEEMLRIIREDEPSKPSTKVSSSESLPSIAANRRIDPQKLGAVIRGELDWIVMKALEKDRGRRYETASKFAEDVEHYLNDEAVIACPPSAAYKFRKFARRNKAVIGTTAAIAATLIIGIVGTSWQAYRATIAERDAVEFAADARGQADRADKEAKLAREAKAKAIAEAQRADHEAEKAIKEAAIAKAVQEFMEDDLLGLAGAAAQINADFTPDPNIKLRTIVDRAADGIEDRFADQPEIKAVICGVLGSIYSSLGDYRKAEEFYKRSAEVGATVWNRNDINMLVAELQIANQKNNLGDSRKAEEIFRRVLPVLQRQAGSDHPATLNAMLNFSALLNDLGHYQEMETLCRETLKTRTRISGAEHCDTISAAHNLAISLIRQYNFHKAEHILRETLSMRARASGTEHPDTVRAMSMLAMCLAGQGKDKDAEQLHREALELWRRVLGPEHPDTLHGMNNLANSFQLQHHFQKAEKLQREALQISQRTLGAEHPFTLNLMHNLAVCLRDQGKSQDAEELQRETLEIRRRVVGPEHPDTLQSMNHSAIFLSAQGKHQDAEILLRETLQISQRTLGSEHLRTLGSMRNLAICLWDQGKSQDAEELQRETLNIRQRVLGPKHPHALGSMNRLAIFLDAQGKYQEAEILYKEILDLQQRVHGPEHPDTLQCMNNLGLCLGARGKHQEAEAILRKATEISRRTLGLDVPITLIFMNNLGSRLNKRGNFQDAETLLRETLQARQRVLGAEHPNTLQSVRNLAISLGGLGKHLEAETLLRNALSGVRKEVGPAHLEILRTEHRLAIVLSALNQNAEAEELSRGTLEINQRVLGPSHPETLRSMNLLGVLQLRQGHFVESAVTLRKSLELHRQTFGVEDPETLHSLSNLVIVLRSQENYGEIESLFHKSLQSLERTVGADDPRTISVRKQLVALLEDRTWHLATDSDNTRRNPTEAVRMGTLACELQPESANNWNNLGVAQYRADDLDAALESLLKADEMIDGGDRQHRMFLAMTLWRLDRKDEAMSKYAQGAIWIADKATNSEEQARFQTEAKVMLGLDLETNGKSGKAD